jgi:glutathione S-transferase
VLLSSCGSSDSVIVDCSGLDLGFVLPAPLASPTGLPNAQETRQAQASCGFWADGAAMPRGGCYKFRMKLLGTDTSPYTRKVRLVLAEKGIPFTFEVAPPREPGSEVPRTNPLGRVPTLLLDDGTAIYDSPVICEYLDGLNDRPVLIPRTDPAARMRVRRWEALADGIMDSAVAVRLESLRPADRQDPAVLALHGNAITRALAHAAGKLAGRTWCEGDGLTLADLALVSALLYLDLRLPERDWRGTHPELRDWSARILERPSLKGHDS